MKYEVYQSKKIYASLFFYLIVILSFIIDCIPIIISSKLGIVDPFLHGKIASAMYFFNKKHINLDLAQFKYTPSQGFLIIILSKICGTIPQNLEYIPLSGVVFIVATYSLARKIFPSPMLSLLVTTVFMYRWVAPYHYGIFPHDFGSLLYILLVSMYLNLENNKSWNTIISLFIIFIGLSLFSYSSQVYAISFSFFVMISVSFSEMISEEKYYLRQRIILMILLMSGIALMNPVLFERYLPKLFSNDFFSNLSIHYFFSRVFKHSPPDPYLFVPSFSHILFFSNAIWYALSILPILLWIFLLLRALYSHKIKFLRYFKIKSFKSMVMLSFFFVMLIDIALYIPIGAITVALSRYFVFTSPLFSIFLFIKFLEKCHFEAKKKNKITEIYALTMCIFSIIIFSYTVASPNIITSPSKYQEALSSAQWFFVKTKNIDFIFSDHHTQGQYAIMASREGMIFNPNNLYTPDSYKHLVDFSYVTKKNSFYTNRYIVINIKLANRKTSAGGWRDLAPLSNYLENIDNNINLVKIYNDENCWVCMGI